MIADSSSVVVVGIVVANAFGVKSRTRSRPRAGSVGKHTSSTTVYRLSSVGAASEAEADEFNTDTDVDAENEDEDEDDAAVIVAGAEISAKDDGCTVRGMVRAAPRDRMATRDRQSASKSDAVGKGTPAAAAAAADDDEDDEDDEDDDDSVDDEDAEANKEVSVLRSNKGALSASKISAIVFSL